MKIWIDMQIPCDVFFFTSVLSGLPEYDVGITSRNYAETSGLLDILNIKYYLIGDQRSGNRLIKLKNATSRTIKLFLKVPKFDISLSFGNLHTIYVSNMRRKPCIDYTDNELGLMGNKSFMEVITWKSEILGSNYIVCPSSFPIKYLITEGMDEDKIFQFDGYKEEVYLADYIPNQSFIENFPLKEFVVIRPEVLSATYVKEKDSLVPELLELFVEEGMKVVYLPRIRDDLKYTKGLNVFIPKKALNGLDLCYYANAVLTGSGTFAREAACMNTTAVSFFPGEKLLAVDQKLANDGRMLHSRDATEIVNYVRSGYKRKKKLDEDRYKKVKQEVIKITRKILNETEIP